jgi:signal transduction histidine kinase
MLYFSRDNRREFITTDILELISGAIALMRTNIRHKKIQIEVNLPEQPVAMRVHPQGVQQIVMNLLDNSCDAVLEKEATSEEMVIQVSGQVEDSNGKPQFILVVEDNGEGIPNHIIQKVKEAFFTTKLAEKGTGLGLSIVNDIVRNHDGTLCIESVEGQFTKMLVSLPIRSDET